MTRPPVLSRRHVLRTGVLAAAAAVALAGCADHRGTAGSTRAVADESDQEVELLTGAITGEQTLLAFCLRLRRTHPDLADALVPIVAGQRAHVRRLADSLTEPPPDTRPPPVPVPRDRARALSSMRRQVATAERERMANCLDATSGLLARLLASVSASHAVTLAAVQDAR